MDGYPEEVVGVALPLIVVIDCDEDRERERVGECVMDWLRSTSVGAEMRISLVTRIRFGRKSQEGRGVDGRPVEGIYEVRGLLKRSWLNRQYNEMGGVFVVALKATKLSECEAENIMERLRLDVGGREVGLVAAVVVESDNEDEEDRAARKRLLAVGSNLVVSRNPGSAMSEREAKLILELAKAQYAARARRVRKWEKALRSPVLLARYGYKQGWWHEFAGEDDKATRAYMSCYAQLQHVAQLLPDQARALADYTNLRLCRLLLRTGRSSCAANQMTTHLAASRSDDPNWRCTQHLVFAQLLAAEPPVPSRTPLTTTTTWGKSAQRVTSRQANAQLSTVESFAFCHASYHYAAAAAWATRCRAGVEHQPHLELARDGNFSVEWVGLGSQKSLAGMKLFWTEALREAMLHETRPRFMLRLRAGLWNSSASSVELQDPALHDSSLEWAGPLVRLCGSLIAVAKLATLSKDSCDIQRALDWLGNGESTGAILEQLWQLEATLTGSRVVVSSDRVALPPPSRTLLRVEPQQNAQHAVHANPPPPTRAAVELSASATPRPVKCLRAQWRDASQIHVLEQVDTRYEPSIYQKVVVPIACLIWLEVAETSLDLFVNRRCASRQESCDENDEYLTSSLASEIPAGYMLLESPPLGWIVVPKKPECRLLAKTTQNVLRLALQYDSNRSDLPCHVALFATAPMAVTAPAKRLLFDCQPAIKFECSIAKNSIDLNARLALCHATYELQCFKLGDAMPTQLSPGDAARLPAAAPDLGLSMSTSPLAHLRLFWRPSQPMPTPLKLPPFARFGPLIVAMSLPADPATTTIEKSGSYITNVATRRGLHAGQEVCRSAALQPVALTPPFAETPWSCQLVTNQPPRPALRLLQSILLDRSSSASSALHFPPASPQSFAPSDLPCGLSLRLHTYGFHPPCRLAFLPLVRGRLRHIPTTSRTLPVATRAKALPRAAKVSLCVSCDLPLAAGRSSSAHRDILPPSCSPASFLVLPPACS